MSDFTLNEDLSFGCEQEETQNEQEEAKLKALWRAVITQALMDASINSHKPKYRVHKIRALKWLEGEDPDFYTICSLADMDPEYVRYKVKVALSNGCKWRNDKKSSSPINPESNLPIQ